MAVDWTPFIDFCVRYEPLFILWDQVIFALFGCFVLLYSFKSRNDPEKKGHVEYFINDFLVGGLLIALAFCLGNLFDNYVQDPRIRAQIYFHLWNSVNVNFIAFSIHLLISGYNARRVGYHKTYEQFKAEQKRNYKDDLQSDLQRKWLHILPIILSIILMIGGKILDPLMHSVGWTGLLLMSYGIFAVGIHFLIILVESDLIRLRKFNLFGRWAHQWMEKAIRPNELNTLVSGDLIILSIFPFFMNSVSLFLCALWITGLSDAMASIVGKTLGRNKIGKGPKTYQGLLAGIGTTYAIVLIINSLFPFAGASFLQINMMALAAAIGFGLVDVFVKKIPDNFMNPMVCGGLIWLVYILF
jgi:dolichol kinase